MQTNTAAPHTAHRRVQGTVAHDTNAQLASFSKDAKLPAALSGRCTHGVATWRSISVFAIADHAPSAEGYLRPEVGSALVLPSLVRHDRSLERIRWFSETMLST